MSYASARMAFDSRAGTSRVVTRSVYMAEKRVSPTLQWFKYQLTLSDLADSSGCLHVMSTLRVSWKIGRPATPTGFDGGETTSVAMSLRLGKPTVRVNKPFCSDYSASNLWYVFCILRFFSRESWAARHECWPTFTCSRFCSRNVDPAQCGCPSQDSLGRGAWLFQTWPGFHVCQLLL